ncbi:pH-sensitive chloride channel 1 isoform 4-T7 [Cochliomyia hominivorax]
MGCSYETAKQSIRINDTSPSSTTTISTSHLNERTKNWNFKIGKQVQENASNNSNSYKLNQHLTKHQTNDDCQLERVQQQQQKLPTINTTSTIKANKTSTATVRKIYNFNNNYNNSNSSCNNNKNKKEDNNINFYSLETKEYINPGNYIIPQENINFEKAEKEEENHVQVLQEFCINCYPLACHKRFCCEQQQQYIQPPHLVTDKISNHTNTRQNLKSPNYINASKNNNNSYSNNCDCNNKKCNDNSKKNCSNNNYCRCHLSFFYPKHTKNTLRNEKQCEPHLCHCNCGTTQTNDFATFPNTHSSTEHCLQKTISYARTSLASNALDLKNNLMEVMANCATVAESLMGINTLFTKNYLKDDNNITRSSISNNNSKIININNNKNHNKSEPYRGYCQCQHHLLNKTNYTTTSSSSSSSSTNYTSSTISNSTTTTATNTNSSISNLNACSLHDAISSNSRCNNNNYDMDINININMNNTNNHRSFSSNNNKRFNKNCNNNYNYQTSSSAHAAAFNYIGQNYYNFLRNTINFYTASSVILVLCYLTSTTSAATTKSDTTSVDKHPIKGIDWSKFDESSSDKEILDLLLEKKRYDKRLLPPVNDEDFCCGLSSPDMATELNSRRPHRRGTLTVNVNVLLLSLASPDESSLKYEVEFLLNQQWNDPRLQYGNKSHYDFLNALHHHDSIWTPDTYFIMHGDFKDPIIPMHFALRIYRNGTITYAMRRHLILSCQGSLHIFPFDDPKCSFSMESISYEEAQIKYVWKNDEDTLRKSPSLTTLNAYLIKNQTTACDQNSWRGNYSCLRVDLIFTRDRAFYFTTVFIPGIILVTSSFITFWLEWNAVPARSMIGNYSCLQVELTFTRDRAYYFTTVFIPGIILVTSSFITFWLEWNAVPARVMIGVTTMLNFFTTSNGFRSTLPVVSNLTAMNVWDGVCMCFIYASLLEFVCVNYMGRKRPQHNVVYRPGENPVTQEIIEREFHAALSSEKAAAGLSSAGTSMGVTPTPATPTSEPLTRVHFYQEPSGGIIATAVQNLRSRSIKRRSNTIKSDDLLATREIPTQMYEHVYTEPGGVTTFAAVPAITTTTVTIENDTTDNVVVEKPKLRRTQSMSTNTPPLICKSEIQTDIDGDTVKPEPETQRTDVEQMPIKPPRKKSSRSTSPSSQYDVLQREIAEMMEISGTGNLGEKKRDASGPNEIVACTTCGGSSGSPCTHSANNGCATETCFVQVRKKEPPHPIRIAKTIDVIARITFPTAYAIFLIFFFVHYKGFS